MLTALDFILFFIKVILQIEVIEFNIYNVLDIPTQSQGFIQL